MLLTRFQEAVDQLYAKIRDTQNENIQKAGQMIADSVLNGGCVHVFDTGHLINAELIHRAGGMVLFKAFNFQVNVNSNARARGKTKKNYVEGMAKFLLELSNVQPGDVMIVGSVSGKTTNVLDVAWEAKKLGVKVIGLSSIEYSSTLPAEHTCGLHLYEIADLAINNCAPIGDAMLEVEGLDAPAVPASGLAAAYIMWGVNACVMENLVKAGKQPGVYKSINYGTTADYNKKLGEAYEKTGF